MVDRVAHGVGRGSTSGLVGILLAAGRGARFGGDKLLATLSTENSSARTDPRHPRPAPGVAGERIGTMACRNLLAALPRVVAVVRPDDAALAAALGAAGARVVRCASADDGMGASLACGVLATQDATGWVVALGDMPWIEPSTIARVAAAIGQGATVAAPFYRGERGHPVGFGAACFAALAALAGDDGARSIVASHRDSVVRIDVDDAGTRRDVDRRKSGSDT
jgi:molybdenum cofactor cytidylyltransferase